MSGPYYAPMSLRIAALGLLAQQPGSGDDLLKQFENSMANVWPATQSQLYSELNKLADGGLIEVSDVGPRGRKVYRITAAGRAELRRWVAHPHDDPPYRSAALLRVFLLGQIPPEAGEVASGEDGRAFRGRDRPVGHPARRGRAHRIRRGQRRRVLRAGGTGLRPAVEPDAGQLGARHRRAMGRPPELSRSLRCITIASDISSMYRKRIRRFLQNRGQTP